MQNYREDILHCLAELKGSGKFATVKETPFVFPGLEVEGLNEIPFPINKNQADLLIQKAHKTPFGKGTETVYDNKVRSGWEIDAEKISFNNPQWAKFINNAIENIKLDLGLEGYEVEANLYKLLIYEEGDFFLTHKDSEKEKGMFATLIVNLPSVFSGGNLIMRFEGEEVIADFSKNTHKIGYTAFYADCDHEVLPVTSGYRVCLTYNLIQKKKKQKIALQSIKQHVNKLAEIFETAIKTKETKPFIVLLGHQYTPENFSADALKLNDRYKAEVLMRAAKKAGCYSKMCLVTSYVLGSPSYDGFYGDFDDVSEYSEMEDIIDETIEIEHWVKNKYPDLGELYLEKKDIISGFNLDEEEPLERESSGYMGNYGPDLEHWYHYGAVVIWTQHAIVPLLLSQNTHTQLEWIDYFNRKSDLNEKGKERINFILKNGLENNRSFRGGKANYNIIADWFINQKEDKFFTSCTDERLQLFFEQIDTEYWVRLFNFFSLQTNRTIFEKLAQHPNLSILEKWIEIEIGLFKENGYAILVKETIETLPLILDQIDSKSLSKISKKALGVLFQIAYIMPVTKEWNEKMAKLFSEIIARKFIHQTLGPQILLTEHTNLLVRLLLEASCLYLQKNIDKIPKEPMDWKQSVPNSKYYKTEWQILENFLKSATATVFNYKATKDLRKDMEQAIKSVTIDLKMETIRKSSPHTLRITKTKASYQREIKKWSQDKELLKKLNNIS